MPEETRVYDYRSSSPADDLRLVVLEKKIRADAAQLEKEICANGGISPKRLHELLALYTIGEVDTFIRQWGPAFESHLDRKVVEQPEDPRIPGWMAQWEEAKDEREEALQRNKGG